MNNKTVSVWKISDINAVPIETRSPAMFEARRAALPPLENSATSESVSTTIPNLLSSHSSISRMYPGASAVSLVICSARTDPMAYRNPPTPNSTNANMLNVAGPLRHPRRPNQLTAGSMANDRNRDTRITMIRDRTCIRIHTTAARRVSPPRNRATALGTQLGIFSLGLLMTLPIFRVNHRGLVHWRPRH